MRCRSLAGSVLLSLVLAGCGEEPPPSPPPPPPPPPPPAPIVAPRAVSSRASFDLVVLPEGAALAWGAPPDEGGGVRAIALGPLGAALGPEAVVARAEEGGSIDEVAAAPAGMRLAVAWVARVGSSLRANASIASAAVERFAPARELGATVPGAHDRSTRGRVAAWGRPDGAATVAHRMPPAACEASTGQCARFSLHTLGVGDDGVEARDAHVNEVREPCEPLIVGGLARGTAFFYGACHLVSGAPATTLYAIDPGGGGALASAPDVLEGCVPLGVAPGASGAVAVGRCGESIGAREVGPRGDLLAGVMQGERSARCEHGRPVLEVRGAQGAVRVALTDSVSRIEALLPDAIAPAGARAVWTGDAVLVASASGRDVTVRRYECEGDALVRTDVR